LPSTRRIVLPFITLCAVLAACGSPKGASEQQAAGQAPGAQPAAPAATGAAALLPHGRELFPGIFTGGQPTAEQFEAARASGVRTVINLRRPHEEGAKGERKQVEKLGMVYVAIPVGGKNGLTEENARQLSQALETAEKPVMVHDSNGNRTGALFAMRAHFVEGKSTEEALAVGRMVGLGALEPRVQDLLEGTAGAAGEESARAEHPKNGEKHAKGTAHKGGKAKKDKSGSKAGKPKSKNLR
jgi:uncharacterized protein (TIGR01244 family)